MRVDLLTLLDTDEQYYEEGGEREEISGSKLDSNLRRNFDPLLLSSSDSFPLSPQRLLPFTSSSE